MVTTKYKKPDWAVDQVIRYDRGGLVEDICKHGVGHPNLEWLKEHGKEGDNIHGCCGCCSEEMKKAIAKVTFGKLHSPGKPAHNINK